MTSALERRRQPVWRPAIRWLVVLLATLGLSLAPLVAAPAQADDELTATLELTGITADDNGLTLELTVTNSGTVPLYGGQVIMWYDDAAMTNADQLATRLAEDPNAAGGARLGSPRSAYHVLGDQNTAFAPGATTPVTLAAAWEDLNFTSPGVYLAGAQVYASATPSATGQVVARARTLVTRPGGVTAREANFVYLASYPSQLDGTNFADDHLAEELAGRLYDLAQLAGRPGWGWIIDPALYYAAQVMAGEDGYQVGATDGQGGDVARRWLDLVDSLPAATGYRTLWGDPDLAAAAAAAEPAVLEQALAHPDPSRLTPGLAQILVLPLADRPAAGLADAGYFDYLAPANVDLSLVRSDAKAPTGVTVTTWPQAYPGGPGPDDPQTVLQINQRRLADDYLAAGQGLASVRVIATAAEAATQSALPSRLPTWVTPCPVTALVAQPTWQAQAATPTPVIPLAAVAAIQAPVLEVVGAAADLLGDAVLARSYVNYALTQMYSQDWASEAQLTAYAAATERLAHQPLDRVQIKLAEQIDLTSRQTSFPLTIANDLDRVVRLRLQFHSDSPLRLAISYPDIIEVKAGDRLTLTLAPKVGAEGEVQLSAWLLTESGLPVSPPVTSTVDISQSGLLALAIVAVSGGILVVGTALRVKTAQRQRRLANEGSQPAEDVSLGDEFDAGLDPATSRRMTETKLEDAGEDVADG